MDARRLAAQLDELARSMRRVQWLVKDLDHNRRPDDVEIAVSGLRLETQAQLYGIERCLRAADAPMPPPLTDPHRGLPPGVDSSLF